MISSRLIKSNDTAAGCENIVDAYDPFGDSSGLALYQLNGDATDVSENYDGTASNVTYGTGVFGQAGVFNGSSSYIKATNPLYTGSSLTDYTVSAWFKINAYGDQYPTIFVTQTGGATLPPYLWISASILRAHGYTYNDYTNTLSTGVWYNAVMVNSGTTTELYLNGVLQTPTSRNIYTSTTGDSFSIGGVDQYPNTTSFDGSLDQVRVFNTALTPLEVEALYIEELCLCDGTVDTLDILDDSSCIALYPLDGNANDLSGNYSGTPTDVSYGVGEFDLAGVFNGSSSYINLGDPTSNITTANYSISFWINTTSTSNSYLISKYLTDGLNSTDIFRVMNLSNGTIQFRTSLSTTPDARDITSTSSINNGNWNHILITVTPSTSKLYINGSQEGGDSVLGAAKAPSTVSRSVTVGRHDGGDNYFNGSIDQVRIFNKALSSSEVTTLYNETACTKAACSGTTNTLDILGDSSCIATYTLDGSPLDLSGNYNGVQTDVTYPQGYFDLAGFFNGSGNITFPDIETFFHQRQTLTLSFWFKCNTPLTSEEYLFSDYATPSFNAVISMRGVGSGNNGKIQVANRMNNSNNEFLTTNTYDDNQWHNIVVINNASANLQTVYIDNTSVGTNAISTNSWVANYADNRVVIGSLFYSINSTYTQFFNGSIDQVRIFNKALSASEVTTLYNETPCN